MRGILSLVFVFMGGISAWMNPEKQISYSPFLIPGPNAIVYQLNGPWETLVPVTLSTDGNQIVAYPSPADVKTMLLPQKLRKGWWLDVRGISANTAFLDYTLEEYANLKEVPSLTVLLQHIKTKKPFKNLYYCGVYDPSNNSIAHINKRIRSNHVKQCSCILK